MFKILKYLLHFNIFKKQKKFYKLTKNGLYLKPYTRKLICCSKNQEKLSLLHLETDLIEQCNTNKENT